MDLQPRLLYPTGDGLGAKAAFSGSLVDGYTLLPVHVWVGWVMLGYVGLCRRHSKPLSHCAHVTTPTETQALKK